MSVKVLVEGADDLRWVWSCADIDTAVRYSMARRPDVVVVDSDILVGSAHLKRRVAEQLAGTVVALVSEAHHVQRLLNDGIRYMISRTVQPADFADLIRRAHYGGALVLQRSGGREGDARDAPRRERSRAELTGRQLKILELISFGFTNNEIAETLTISRETVRTHVKNIFRVLEVKNRAHAVTVAYTRGVLDNGRLLPSVAGAR
ncbi:DNA-binding response regulator [Amycolatopsis lurida]